MTQLTSGLRVRRNRTSTNEFTTVTGRVIDPTGLPYSNGTLVATLTIPGTPRFIDTGLEYTPPVQPTLLDAEGRFVIQLADLNALIPFGGAWNFTVCSAQGTIQPGSPITNGPICFDVLGVVVTGPALDLSPQLDANAKNLSGITVGSGIPAPRWDQIGSAQADLTLNNGTFSTFFNTTGIWQFSETLRTTPKLCFGSPLAGIGPGNVAGYLAMYFTGNGQGVQFWTSNSGGTPFQSGTIQAFVGSLSIQGGSGIGLQTLFAPAAGGNSAFCILTNQFQISSTTAGATAVLFLVGGNQFSGGGFNPSSGTCNFVNVLSTIQINQSGTASGNFIMLGAYPLITSIGASDPTKSYLLGLGTASALFQNNWFSFLTTLFAIDMQGHMHGNSNLMGFATSASGTSVSVTFPNPFGTGIFPFVFVTPTAQCGTWFVGNVTNQGFTIFFTEDVPVNFFWFAIALG